MRRAGLSNRWSVRLAADGQYTHQRRSRPRVAQSMVEGVCSGVTLRCIRWLSSPLTSYHPPQLRCIGQSSAAGLQNTSHRPLLLLRCHYHTQPCSSHESWPCVDTSLTVNQHLPYLSCHVKARDVHQSVACHSSVSLLHLLTCVCSTRVRCGGHSACPQRSSV